MKQYHSLISVILSDEADEGSLGPAPPPPMSGGAGAAGAVGAGRESAAAGQRAGVQQRGLQKNPEL